MKLAYITATMPTGPGESFLVEEALEIRGRGHQIHIVPRSPSKQVVHRDAQQLMLHAVIARPWGLTCIAGALREFLRTPVVCCRTITLVMGTRRLGPMIKNILTLPKGLWLSSYVRKHGIEHIHCHWAATTATMALIASKVSGIPWSLTLHRGDIRQGNLLRQKIASARFARFISESGLRLAREVDAGVCFNNATVIPMGVRVPDCIQVPSDDPPIILCPAALVPVKGHAHLIEALGISIRRGALWEVWLAGDGPLRTDIGARAASLGVSKHVTFLGELDHTRLLALYREAKIAAVVLPSLDLGDGLHEGVPVSLIEAMAFGVPVISTTTGGIPELVSEGAGILIPPGDPAQLAGAIEALAQSADLRIRLGAAGREVVLNRHSVAVVVDTLLDAMSGSIRRVNPDGPAVHLRAGAVE